MWFRLFRSRTAVVLIACGALAMTGTALALPHGDPPAPRLTGRQLAARLIPGSSLPRGYQLEAAGVEDSGSRLEVAAGEHDLATMSCLALSEFYGRIGFGESALAEDAYIDGSGPGGTVLIQQVYQFSEEIAAAAFWHGLRAISIRCPGLGAEARHDASKVVQHVLAVRYGQSQAFEIDISETRSRSGIVNLALLVVLKSDDVFTVGAMGFARGVPSDPALQSLMTELLSRVKEST